MPDDPNPTSPRDSKPGTSRAGTRTLDYARREVDALTRWFLRTFTRENIFAAVRTFAWVAPLTILIWIYAEREQEYKISNVTIPIRLKSADPGRIVTLLMRDSNIETELIGPRAAVERVLELVRPRAGEPAVQIEIGRNFEPGRDHQLSALNLLNDSEILKSHGVSVRETPKPQYIEFKVDELSEREVDVQAPATVTNLAAKPVFEPRSVRVRGPRTLLEGGALSVTADLAGRDELRIAGSHELSAVGLTSSVEAPSISIVPSTVKATITVNQPDLSLRIPSMAILKTEPVVGLDNYKVVFDPPGGVITNVTIIGPPDKIQMLTRENAAPPYARIEIRAEDIGKPLQERQLKFDLPEGVYVSKEDLARAKVSFRLVPVQPSE